MHRDKYHGEKVRAECRKSKERTLAIPAKEVANEEVETVTEAVAEEVLEAVTEEIGKVQIHIYLQDEKITQKIDSR